MGGQGGARMEERVVGHGDRFAPGSFAHVDQSLRREVPVFPGSEDVDPAQVFAGPGYTSPKPPSTALAQVALWLCVGGIFLPFLLPVATLLSVIALVRSSGQKGAVRHTALSALVVSLVAIILMTGSYLLITSA